MAIAVSTPRNPDVGIHASACGQAEIAVMRAAKVHDDPLQHHAWIDHSELQNVGAFLRELMGGDDLAHIIQYGARPAFGCKSQIYHL
jgi:hypothetical protein